jgi:hypothetical protein
MPSGEALHVWPEVTTGQGRAMLEHALVGLDLGPVDKDAQDRLTGPGRPLDPAIVAAVVASWLRRTFEAGLNAGRAERVDEAAAVQQVLAETAQARTDAETYGQVIDAIVTAAADAEVAAEDDTADHRTVLTGLLFQIERAAGLITGGRP